MTLALVAPALSLVAARPGAAPAAAADAVAGQGGAPLQLVPAHGAAPIAARITAGSRRWGQAVLVNVSTDLRLTVAIQGAGAAGPWFAPVPAVVELAPGQRQPVAFGIAPPDDRQGRQPGALVARVVGARAVAGGSAVVVRVPRVTLGVVLDVVARVPRSAARSKSVPRASSAQAAAAGQSAVAVSSAPGRRADVVTLILIAACGAAIITAWMMWPRLREARAAGAIVALDVSTLNDALTRRSGSPPVRRVSSRRRS